MGIFCKKESDWFFTGHDTFASRVSIGGMKKNRKTNLVLSLPDDEFSAQWVESRVM